MKKISIILFLFLSIISLVYSQPSITWQRLYNGYHHQNNGVYSICNADNSNFYMGGMKEDSLQALRYNYIMKINSYGEVIWTKVFQIYGNGYVYAIAMTPDSGCIFTGDAFRAYTVRLDKMGNVIWQKQYDTTLQNVKILYIKTLNNSNYLACGHDLFNIGYIMKINSSGNLVWHQILTNGYYHLSSNDVSNDNEYLVAGYYWQSYNDTTRGLVLKIDTSGNTISTKYYKINNRAAEIDFIKKLTNYYIIAGEFLDTLGTSFYLRPFIGKIDFNGNLYWTKTFYNIKNERLNKFNVINDNKFVYSIYYWSYYSNDSSYFRIMTTDSLGNIINEKKIMSIEVDSPTFWLDGIQPVRNGDILFVGSAYYPGLSDNVYAIRTDSTLNYPNYFIGLKKDEHSIPRKIELFQNFPNPFNPITTIKFSLSEGSITKLIIYDILGCEIATLVNEKLQAGNYEIMFNASDLTSGVYFYKLSAKNGKGDFNESKKFVILK